MHSELFGGAYIVDLLSNLKWKHSYNNPYRLAEVWISEESLSPVLPIIPDWLKSCVGERERVQ